MTIIIIIIVVNYFLISARRISYRTYCACSVQQGGVLNIITFCIIYDIIRVYYYYDYDDCIYMAINVADFYINNYIRWTTGRWLAFYSINIFAARRAKLSESAAGGSCARVRPECDVCESYNDMNVLISPGKVARCSSSLRARIYK